MSTLAATGVMYGRSMVVTVNGLDLDQGITMSADPGCAGIEAVPGGGASTRQFTCKVDTTGPLTVQIDRSGGGRLARLALDVPLPVARLTTNLGVIEIELDPAEARRTVDNFLGYLNAGFYRDVVFHRVDRDAGVIQAGAFETGLVPKAATQPPIPLETQRNLLNLRGTIGMARLPDPDSATSQFFINLRDNPGFDFASAAQPGYAVFGRVTVGLDTVDSIGGVAVESRAVAIDGVPLVLPSVPIEEVVILGASQIR